MASSDNEGFFSSTVKLVITTFLTAVITHWVTKMFEEKKLVEEKSQAVIEMQKQAGASSQNVIAQFNDKLNVIEQENNKLKQQVASLSGQPVPDDNTIKSSIAVADFSGSWIESTGGVELKVFNNQTATIGGVGEVAGLISGTGTCIIDRELIVITFTNAYFLGESVGSLTYELNIVGSKILNGNAKSIMGNNPIAFYKS